MKDKENSREIQFKEELVRKAKNGDTKAFSLLYAGVCKEMYKFALYMMRHTEDAEDAVSETVISARNPPHVFFFLKKHVYPLIIYNANLYISLQTPAYNRENAFVSPFFALRTNSSLNCISLEFSLSFIRSLLSNHLFHLKILITIFMNHLYWFMKSMNSFTLSLL